MGHATEAVPSWHRIVNVPKSMPMTWPLTFSSPPVEAYRARNDVVGERMFENREIGDDRGSYEKSVKQAPLRKTAWGRTALDSREAIMLLRSRPSTLDANEMAKRG